MKSLRMKWIWIAGLVVGIGCGDDDSVPENNVSANIASSNNQTNSDENNTGTANQGSENNLIAPKTNNQNTSTNNTATNNTTNNTNNTSSNNQMMGISCMEILQCLLVCTTGDETCQAECSSQGTPSAQMEIDAFLGCVDTHCEDAMTVTTLTECTLENCSEEQNTCLGM